MEHARRRAIGERLLGDQLFWQMEIEVANEHASIIRMLRRGRLTVQSRIMRKRFTWNTGQRLLELGERTLIVGVINVTPDSFSDGGLFLTADDAVAHGLHLLDEGADILDLGGESTRPGASVESEEVQATNSTVRRKGVSAEEELRRILPVIEALKHARPKCMISVDTYKSEVAREAVRAGAEIVNDVSAFTWDTRMAATVAELDCGVILMHTRGLPEQWRTLPPAEDIVGLVRAELQELAQGAIAQGVQQNHMVLDPGFGFGKNFDENYSLLAQLGKFAELGFPLLAGTSRKSFIGRTVGRRLGAIHSVTSTDQPANQRFYGTLASVVASILKGAHLVRVHDVRAAVEAAAVGDAILAAS